MSCRDIFQSRRKHETMSEFTSVVEFPQPDMKFVGSLRVGLVYCIQEIIRERVVDPAKDSFIGFWI